MTRPTSGRPARTRLSPGQRRDQLIELGMQLLATRSLEELSVDLLSSEAGISRGLLYHYFGSKDGYHEAVVRHAADLLIDLTAPPATGNPLERLFASVTAYVDWVQANSTGFRSLLRAAASDNGAVRDIYEEARSALVGRFFSTETSAEPIPDTPAIRLALEGWTTFTEDVVNRWLDDDAGLDKEQLVSLLIGALPAIIAHTPDGLPNAIS